MRALARWFWLVFLAAVGLQLFFAVRIASMAVWAPESTAFERSQIWQVVNRHGHLPWRQVWVDRDHITPYLQKAVIVSEDSTFQQHGGVWWESLEKAWEKNAKAQAVAEQRAQRRPESKTLPVKIVGGSTITQQLAKNLFLSGERTLVRKGQEMLIALTLEACLSKGRILEIYLNSVEWGQGVFGAEAAAQHYFRKSADRLNPWEAARLAVMLPRPRYFEQRAQSAYLASRAETIMARAVEVQLP
jgi:monofunctional biosynthetic peptidoglycan transglycosylase